MQLNLKRFGLGLALFIACGTAAAHPGHGMSYMSGLAHPLSGADHLLAMLAVGLWASQLVGRARWLVPASFVTVMTVAGGLGMAGIALPMVESGIAASVLALGLLVAMTARLPVASSSALVALFAVFHGYAHGAEMPAEGSVWAYGLGFVLSTAALHVAGLVLGRFNHKLARVLGAAIAMAGAAMLAVA